MTCDALRAARRAGRRARHARATRTRTVRPVRATRPARDLARHAHPRRPRQPARGRGRRRRRGRGVRSRAPRGCWSTRPRSSAPHDTGHEFAPADALVAELHRRDRGLRLAAAGNPVELMVPTVLEQKVTSTEAHRAYSRLVRAPRAPGAGAERGAAAAPDGGRARGAAVVRMARGRRRAAAGGDHPRGVRAGRRDRAGRGPGVGRVPAAGDRAAGHRAVDGDERRRARVR